MWTKIILLKCICNSFLAVRLQNMFPLFKKKYRKTSKLPVFIECRYDETIKCWKSLMWRWQTDNLYFLCELELEIKSIKQVVGALCFHIAHGHSSSAMTLLSLDSRIVPTFSLSELYVNLTFVFTVNEFTTRCMR